MLAAWLLACAPPAAARQPLVEAARAQVGVTVAYDPAYRRLDYPGGDVPIDRGVCTDVIVRALRRLGIDLQARIHEDKRANPDAYPRRWRHQPADASIDHRRVPNQMAWFARQGWRLDPGTRGTGFAAGDIVAWDLGGGVLHVGIVSDRRAPDGTPLVLHNIARGTREEDLLLRYRIIGHYRPRLPGPRADAPAASPVPASPSTRT